MRPSRIRIGYAEGTPAEAPSKTATGAVTLASIIASGVAALTPSGPVITDVNTTESWTDGDTGLVITGTGFV